MTARLRPLVVLVFAAPLVFAAMPPVATAEDPELPLVLEEDFEKGAGRWKPTDTSMWRIEKSDQGAVYSQFKKEGSYEPPHRSPFNIALVKDVLVGDMVLTAKVRSTTPDYPHRDACLVFGYQDPAHFYYVHFGKEADDHANQVFIVNDAPRTKISLTSTPGTNWTDQWHQVKVVRTVGDGKIAVYFDDMEKPVMTARDERFRWGGIGLGSFDDTTQWDEVRLYGRKVQRPAEEAD